MGFFLLFWVNFAHTFSLYDLTFYFMVSLHVQKFKVFIQSNLYFSLGFVLFRGTVIMKFFSSLEI